MRMWSNLGELGLDAGKKTRLHRILYQYGLRNGTALVPSLRPGPGARSARLLRQPPGRRPGVHRQARRRRRLQRHRPSGRPGGEVLLGLRGRGTADPEAEREDRHPADDRALSPLHATVEEAVRLGADAVGYTLYVGTPAAEADFAQYRQVRGTPGGSACR